MKDEKNPKGQWKFVNPLAKNYHQPLEGWICSICEKPMSALGHECKGKALDKIEELERVTPNREHVPKRAYIRFENGYIRCIDSESGVILFSITLTNHNAKLLMEDLYYGEYTGA